MNSCHSLVRICYNIQLQYNFGADKCSCEINLFNNKTTPNCLFKTLAENVTWMPLKQKNQWVYATLSTAQVTAVCGREIISLNLEESGILTMEPECILKHDRILITGEQSISTMTASSCTSLGKISDLAYATAPNTERTTRDTHSSVPDSLTKDLNEIRALQSKLKSIKNAEFQNSSSSTHGITLAYLALVVSMVATIILLIGVICHKCSRTIQISEGAHSSCRDSQILANTAAPLPTPRQNFTLQI